MAPLIENTDLAYDAVFLRRTLEAIIECRCRFRRSQLEHAREAVQYCRAMATAGLAGREISCEEADSIDVT